MAAFDFPDSPTNGQLSTQNGIEYIYDSANDSWSPTGEDIDTGTLDNLILLTGVAAQSVNLGTIPGTGSTVADNATILEAFQDIDEAFDTINTDLLNDTTPQLGGNLDLNTNDITGTGNIAHTGNLTTTGNILVTGTVDGRDVLDDGQAGDNLITLTGVARDATNLGGFTGSTITDNTDLKDALQDLETALEALSFPEQTVLTKTGAFSAARSDGRKAYYRCTGSFAVTIQSQSNGGYSVGDTVTIFSTDGNQTFTTTGLTISKPASFSVAPNEAGSTVMFTCTGATTWDVCGDLAI